jgi:DNA-directed RNA polymerase subunit L
MTDVSIKQLYYKDKPKTDSRLELQFNGSDINHVIMNSLRRTILLNLPNYAFDPKNIQIETNTSGYNNDMLRLRISNMPTINIEPSDDTLKLVNDLENNKNISSDKTLSMVVEFENKTTEIIPVTTKHAKFFINNNVAPEYPIDFLLVKLKPNQKIKLVATTNLDIPKKNDIYTSVAICTYEYEDESNIIFKLESRGSLNEYEIIKRSSKILIDKLETTLDKLLKMNFANKQNGSIILEKETFTLANLITNGLQNHKNIEFAGYKIDHLLIEEAEIKYATDGKDIRDILKDTISKQIKIYEKIISQLKK